MFVAINNKNIGIIAIDGWIKNVRNAGGISPDFAMSVLSKTNHRSHIKTLLTAIKKNIKATEDIVVYKDFVLACVDEREMSENAMNDLREMADFCGVREEFEELNNKPKFYEKLDCDQTKIVISREEFNALEGDNLAVYFDADKVGLERADLSKVRAIKFKERADVDLKKAINLPQFLDVSTCSKITLLKCDLSSVRELKFSDGAMVYLPEVNNLPKNLDFSKCIHVSLHGADLKDYNELKFKDGAEVYLYALDNLPKNLDLSMCSRVILNGCDLSKVDKLEFREGSHVELERLRGLHGTLDVSKCMSIDIGMSDFCKITELKLKDKNQEKRLKRVVENFAGRIVYTSENGSVLANVGDGINR